MKKLLSFIAIVLVQFSLVSQVSIFSTAKIPTQTGNAGKVLGTNGSVLSWTTATGSSTVGLASLSQTIAAGTTTASPSEDAVYNYIATKTTTLQTILADAVTTLSTAVLITGTTFSMQPNSVYLVHAIGRVGCNNTGGVKFGQNTPSGSICRVRAFGTTNTFASYNTVLLSTSGALYPSSAYFNSVSGASGMIQFDGLVTTSATGGNFELLFSSVTAGQTSTIYSDSFVITYYKIN